MAKSYLHKQTIVIAIICFLAVGATAGYVYTQSPTPASTDITVQDAKTNTVSDVATNNVDWKKQFLDITGGSNAITGKASLTQPASDTPLTLTDQVSRDLFARYIQLKQNNLDTNPQLVQDSIDQTIASAQVGAAQPKIYGIKDITISTNSSAQSIRAYGNAVATIFLTYTPKQSPTDIATNAFYKNKINFISSSESIL